MNVNDAFATVSVSLFFLLFFFFFWRFFVLAHGPTPVFIAVPCSDTVGVGNPLLPVISD